MLVFVRAGEGCHVTTAYEILNDDGVTATCLFHIDGDVTLYAASGIVATINILQNTAGDGQGDITKDMSVIGSAVNILDGAAGARPKDNIHIAVDVASITATIETCNLQGA